jgi:pimeloyl-ACP methyl ester carboxylesterase
VSHPGPFIGTGGDAMPMIPIRDTSLYVDIIGDGYPLALMHGGPGLDHWTLAPLRQLSDRYRLIFYDHRCNGRSLDAPVETMTWDNLTADADALRQHLGYEKWAVLGHSFGGNVALEYALRFPGNLSHLVLLDTGANGRWSQVNAAQVAAQRGYGPEKVQLIRRWFSGDFEPDEWFSIFSEIAGAYYYEQIDFARMALEMPAGEGPTFRPEPLIFAGRHLLNGWSVTDRLSEMGVPTLVIAGMQDFVYPPEAQHELANGIPNARLRLIDRAGHNPQAERPDEVLEELRAFLGPVLQRDRAGGVLDPADELEVHRLR